MRVAAFFGLSWLAEAAEARLLRSRRGGGPFCVDGVGLRAGDAAAMPLFAASFGQGWRRISSACLLHLTSRGASVLRGRERQLGVLYATHPVAATVLSGIFRAALAADRVGAVASAHCSDANRTMDPALVDLMLGARALAAG